MRNFINIIESAQPKWFHASTGDDIVEFLPLTHFGTLKAAKQRGKYRAKQIKAAGYFLYEVSLSVSNPLRTTDEAASDEATMLRAMIRGEFPNDDFDLSYAREHGAYAEIIRKGYDGMIYENRVEDMGRDSIVIMRSDQATIVGVVKIP